MREASRLLRQYNPAQEIYPFREQQVVDAGEMAVNPFSIAEAVVEIERGALDLLERAPRLLTIGGDHTISLPLLRALCKKHGAPITVIRFDAHLDTFGSYFGADITHGTPFRLASEEGLIDRESSMHLGIRGPLYGAENLTDD